MATGARAWLRSRSAGCRGCFQACCGGFREARAGPCRELIVEPVHAGFMLVADVEAAMGLVAEARLAVDASAGEGVVA